MTSFIGREREIAQVCLDVAPNEEMVREHARKGGFPANRVAPVRKVIDPTTSEP